MCWQPTSINFKTRSGTDFSSTAAVNNTGFLWTPPKPGQIRVLPHRGRRTSSLFNLALFPEGVFLAPLNLLRDLTGFFRRGRFARSSNGLLLGGVISRLPSKTVSFMMSATIPSLHGVLCCLNRDHGRWSWSLVQPCRSECPG